MWLVIELVQGIMATNILMKSGEDPLITIQVDKANMANCGWFKVHNPEEPRAMWLVFEPDQDIMAISNGWN